MEIYYVNSAGQRIDFTGENYKMLAVSDLFDYRWEYTTSGVSVFHIASFNKRFVERQVSLVISAETKAEYYREITDLLEVIDSDVSAGTPGRLYVGETYLQCFFLASQKPKRYLNTRNTTVDLRLIAENGNWIHEERKSFFPAAYGVKEDGLDHPHDYAFDFCSNLTNQRMVNSNYAASDFEMIIYGPCLNPAISVGAHTYEVDTDLRTGEYMVINSSKKRVYKVKNDGELVNLFYARGRDYYIFEKISGGTVSVSWNGSFGFDITLLSERSEPIWI